MNVQQVWLFKIALEVQIQIPGGYKYGESSNELSTGWNNLRAIKLSPMP